MGDSGKSQSTENFKKINDGLVSIETVLLHRQGSGTQKFGINQVDRRQIPSVKATEANKKAYKH